MEAPLVLRAAVKPTPSISQPQQTVTNDGQIQPFIVTGRHDPIIVPRAVVVVESMAAITIADLFDDEHDIPDGAPEKNFISKASQFHLEKKEPQSRQGSAFSPEGSMVLSFICII